MHDRGQSPHCTSFRHRAASIAGIFALAAVVLPAARADPPDRPSVTPRPVVIAVLKDGERIEGLLERFDDGEYWVLIDGRRRKFAEDGLASIEFHVPARGEPQGAEDRAIAELIRRFFRPTVGTEGTRQGVDPTLVSDLAAAGPRAVRPLLAAFQKQEDDYQAVGEVPKQMGPEVFPLLIECVREDPGRSARFPVWYALRESGVEHPEFVRGLLKDRDPRIRELAMEVLYCWSITSGVALPPSLDLALIQVLDDPEQDVRAQAPLILGRIGFNSGLVLPALLRTMEDDRYASVRNKSVIALGYLGRDLKAGDPDLERIVAALSAAVTGDPSDNVRSYAARHLGFMGAKAAAALPALRRATDDKKELVRKYAEEALQNVQELPSEDGASRPRRRSRMGSR